MEASHEKKTAGIICIAVAALGVPAFMHVEVSSPGSVTIGNKYGVVMVDAPFGPHAFDDPEIGHKWDEDIVEARALKTDMENHGW
jgi:hypothetical protein